MLWTKQLQRSTKETGVGGAVKGGEEEGKRSNVRRLPGELGEAAPVSLGARTVEEGLERQWWLGE